MNRWRGIYLLPLIFTTSLWALPQERSFTENFESLDSWEKIQFSNISQHTTYTIEKKKEGTTYLKTESDASASGIISSQEIYMSQTPMMTWRWKVENIYSKGDLRKKAGDDAPLRMIVLFDDKKKKKSLWSAVQSYVGEELTGHPLPHSALHYVWASNAEKGSSFHSPYTDRVNIIVKQSGNKNIGKWLTEKVNVVADYQKAFGKEPPATARIAIMNDADNTGEASLSFVAKMTIGSIATED